LACRDFLLSLVKHAAGMSGKQVEAVIISPKVFLPSLRDVAWAGIDLRVPCRIQQHTLKAQKDFKRAR